jgi:hypothetical protein
MKEFMNEILVNVKDEFKEVVESELNRVREDFNFLTDDEKDSIYDSHGSVCFVFDKLEELDPSLEIKNTPIQFDPDEVLIDTLDEEEKYEVLEMIVDYCSYDTRF